MSDLPNIYWLWESKSKGKGQKPLVRKFRGELYPPIIGSPHLKEKAIKVIELTDELEKLLEKNENT